MGEPTPPVRGRLAQPASEQPSFQPCITTPGTPHAATEPIGPSLVVCVRCHGHILASHCCISSSSKYLPVSFADGLEALLSYFRPPQGSFVRSSFSSTSDQRFHGSITVMPQSTKSLTLRVAGAGASRLCDRRDHGVELADRLARQFA